MQENKNVPKIAIKNWLEKKPSNYLHLGGVNNHGFLIAEFMNNEVPGARVPPEIMERMRKANEKGSEFACQEGITIARETLSEIKDMVEGVQISPPFGRVEVVKEIISVI